MSILTFFAALCNKMAISPLKLSISAYIEDAEIVGADLQRANIGDMKKLTIAMIP